MIFKKVDGVLSNEELFKQNLNNLKDGEYEIIPLKKDRTSQQNRYLW
jgi:hypothetical protein